MNHVPTYTRTKQMSDEEVAAMHSFMRETFIRNVIVIAVVKVAIFITLRCLSKAFRNK